MISDTSQAHQPDFQTPFVPMNGKRLAHVALLGAVVGITAWGLVFLLDTYVLRALLCQGNQTMQCVPGTLVAEIVATIIAAGLGLFGLVKLEVFRPLVVVLAVTAGLWSLTEATAVLPWYGDVLSYAGLYMAAYLLFAWIARIRLFWLMIIIAAALVVAMRLMLTA